MNYTELVRHLRDEHHIEPISLRLSDQPHLRLSRAGGKGDLATYHEDVHDERQEELDHKH